MSIAARRAVDSAAVVLLRTAFHPAAKELVAEGRTFRTFDQVYETAASFEEVYSRIADDVMAGSVAGDVVYCVPGHPLFGEESVRLILERAEREGIPVRLVGSSSFVEAAIEAAGVCIDEGIKIIDALSIGRIKPSPDVPNLFYQVHDRTVASELKLLLLEEYPDGFEVYLIRRAGSPDEQVERLPLYELDRREYDHLTSVLVPRLWSAAG